MNVVESILREVRNLPLRQQVKVARYVRELSESAQRERAEVLRTIQGSLDEADGKAFEEALTSARRLHQLRDRADLSLRELAKKVGISGPFLSDIELGRRFPSEEILGKLARALNVPLEDLKKYDNREPIADLATTGHGS
jgi:DNA-binding XRE family transcriptional regulator